MPLTEPTRLVLRKGWQPMDADAAAYISDVEAADTAAGQTGGLEERVKIAIDNFVLGCKADGIWSAIKASCILAGARTLNGALVPLVGTAPTNNGPFVAGDYNRKTGLVGNGSTKYLNSNRNNNADPQNSKHISVYITTGSSGTGQTYLGVDGGDTGATSISRSGVGRINAGTFGTVDNPGIANGLFGASRSSSASFLTRYNAANKTYSVSSQTPSNRNLTVFAMDNIGSIISYSQDRLAFYSIGESLDLALLDARVTDLITAFGAAIP